MAINIHETCLFCKHYHSVKSGKWTPGGQKCDAFPQGIPLMIRENKISHITPYPGDNGIQFEPREQLNVTTGKS